MMNAKEILVPIIDAGYAAYIAGGSVRSFFFNELPHDIDICTNAPENVLRNLFSNISDISKNMNLKVFLVKIGNNSYEVAHFRCNEIYSDDHRTPTSVEFDCQLKEDAARRDFKMNSMFMAEDGTVIDFFGGQEDIKRKILSTVGNPDDRFAEDVLRILRAVRFAAKYDLFIEDNTRTAMKKFAGNLKDLPFERITSELEKMMEPGGKKFSRALKIMRDTGILEVILPEIARLENFPHDPDHHPEGWVLQHCLEAVATVESNDPLILWSTLFHDVGKAVTYKYRYKPKKDIWRHTYYSHDIEAKPIIDEIGKRLRLPTKTIDVANYCARYHMIAFKFEEMKPKTLFKIVDNPYFDYLMEVSKADIMARNLASDFETLEKRRTFMLKLREKMKLAKSITGKDVMEISGIPEGPKVGKTLLNTRAWILKELMKNCSEFPTKEILNKKIKEFAKMS